MRRQRRSLKRAGLFSNVDFKSFVLNRITGIIPILIFTIIALFLMSVFFRGADYFKLKSVEIRGLSEVRSAATIKNELLRSERSKDLFKIDLAKIASIMSSRYPDAKELSINRVFPDKILVNFKFARPIAVISNGKSKPIDKDGFILSDASLEVAKELPLITGIDLTAKDAVGRRCDSRNLKFALDLLEEIERTKFLAAYGVARIDAGDINGLSFYLKNGLEVRIGCEDFRKRLALLKQTLKNPRLVMERIRYIDVRFEDAVIGPV